MRGRATRVKREPADGTAGERARLAPVSAFRGVRRIGPVRSIRQPAIAVLSAVFLAIVAFGCESAPGAPTPPPTPGTPEHPRELNLIASEYAFAPSTLDVVAGETVVIHVVNAGLDIHEAVIGGGPTQDAWERAEAAVAGAPPGPTPLVSVSPDLSGIRVVVRSGQRVDVTWTVPAAVPSPFVVGCHIPGHWAKGMQVPIRIVPAQR